MKNKLYKTPITERSTVETQTINEPTQSTVATNNKVDNFYDEISLQVTSKIDKQMSLIFESDYKDPIDFEPHKKEISYSQVNKRNVAVVENLYDDVDCDYENFL